MEIKTLNQISEVYADYIRKSSEEKLHAGDLLQKTGDAILDISESTLDLDGKLNRRYLMDKIAGDLLKQAERMAYTKQYDCSPKLKDYTYLAWHLACDFCEMKADRRLLPFLTQVMYYEKFNEDKTELNRLKAIFDDSLKLEQKHLDYLINTDRL